MLQIIEKPEKVFYLVTLHLVSCDNDLLKFVSGGKNGLSN